MKKTRLIVVGGFLGAGKTTLLIAASQALRQRRHRVGVVVNDQSADLVDTALLRSIGVAVGDVSGGCFCCRFPDLEDAVRSVQGNTSTSSSLNPSGAAPTWLQPCCVHC